MNLPDLWIVLDIGTTELKGALTNSQGEIKKESSRANHTNNSLSGFEEKMLRNGGNWYVKFFLN